MDNEKFNPSEIVPPAASTTVTHDDLDVSLPTPGQNSSIVDNAHTSTVQSATSVFLSAIRGN